MLQTGDRLAVEQRKVAVQVVAGYNRMVTIANRRIGDKACKVMVAGGKLMSRRAE